MKKRWAVLTITAALTVYTVAVVLGFIFIPKAPAEENTDTNYFWVRSYSYIDYTDEEKADIIGGIGLDLNKLTAQGFPLMREAYMSPSKWRKELHVIELSFENIYCTVTINVHADEIGWERERETLNPVVKYTPLEIIGLDFDRNGKTLRRDDTARGVLFLFNCSAEPDDALYQEFLQLFLIKDNG